MKPLTMSKGDLAVFGSITSSAGSWPARLLAEVDACHAEIERLRTELGAVAVERNHEANQNDTLRSKLTTERAAREKAEAHTADLQSTFDLRYRADMRAIDRWREGHPERNLQQPDHADLVLWLAERAEKAESDAAGLRFGLRQVKEEASGFREAKALAEHWLKNSNAGAPLLVRLQLAEEVADAASQWVNRFDVSELDESEIGMDEEGRRFDLGADEEELKALIREYETALKVPA